MTLDPAVQQAADSALATTAAILDGSMPALSAVSAIARRRPSFHASAIASSRAERSTMPVGERSAIAIEPLRRSATMAGRSLEASTISAAGSGR